MNRKDYFYKKAKKEKYPARSVYKLEEIDRKYRLVKKGMKVLDLGCCPGSYLRQRLWEKMVSFVVWTSPRLRFGFRPTRVS